MAMIPRRRPVPGQPATGGGLPPAKPPLRQPVATNLAEAQANRARAQATLKARGGAQAAPGALRRFQNANQAVRDFRKNQVSTQPVGPAIPLDPNQPPPGAAPEQPPVSQPQPQPDLSAQFPDANNFMAEDYQGSPTYKFQMDQGQRALNRLMAARGLTGSGAEIEANSRFLNELGAQESDKWWNRANTTADRLERMKENEANRGLNREQNQWGRYTDLMDFADRQNPMRYAFQGLENYGNIGLERGKGRAGFQRDNYRRVQAPAGGGGGGAPPIFQPPFPNSPDYSMLDMIGAGSGSQSRGNWWDIGMDLVGSFF